MFEGSFKVVLLGYTAVGKTSLLNRYFLGEFQPEYIPTIKTSIFEKTFNFPMCSLKVFFWDADSEQVFSDEGGTGFFANSQGAVMVYDVCRPASLNAIEQYYKILIKHVDKPVLWLVGNKMDLREYRRVDIALAKRRAEELGASYMETSAKSGENVQALFTLLIKDLVRARLMKVRRQLEEGHKHG